jgi:RNA polymerase sigma-70 factor (ECF subfamily)
MEELGNQEPARGVSPEQLFLRSWAEATLAEALEDLRRELDARGRGKMFEAFREYCLEAEPGRDISYRSIREKLGLSESEVTNYISESRRALRLILVGKVGGTVGSPREVDEELGILFGSR